MRVGLDGTPLLGARTGVGTYTEHLVRELSARGDVEPVVTAFTARGGADLAAELPAGVAARAPRVPARALRAAWLAGAGPAGERLAGPVDVFHGTNYVLPPLRRACGVVTVHDLAFLRHPETVARASLDYRELVALALRRGAHVVTPSRAVADQVLDAWAVGDAGRVHVTPLGVDPAWAAAAPPDERRRATLGLPSTYVVAVGTLEPRKNLARLLDAYRLGVRGGADLAPLVLVGAAGWGPALDTSGLPDHLVVRLGRLDLSDLRTVVAGAQTLVFPSVDEGFGLPPLEALACGTAVVAADLPVTREVLGPEATYADPWSPPALLHGLTTGLAEPAGTPASRRARARTYTWARCATATVAAYRAATGA